MGQRDVKNSVSLSQPELWDSSPRRGQLGTGQFSQRYKVKSSAEAAQNREEETSSQDMVGAGDFSRTSAYEGGGAEETTLIF